MICRFCKGPAELACSWPVRWRFVRVPIETIEDGEWIELYSNNRVLNVGCVAENLHVAGRTPTLECRQLVVMRAYLFRDPDDSAEPEWLGTRGVLPVYSVGTYISVARRGPCGSACCDLHRREVADGRAYCMAHWSSWSAA